MLVDGWLHTGDAARLDGDGFAWIVGRVRDAFLVHGQTIHPGDVERALTAHPKGHGRGRRWPGSRA